MDAVTLSEFLVWAYHWRDFSQDNGMESLDFVEERISRTGVIETETVTGQTEEVTSLPHKPQERLAHAQRIHDCHLLATT
eukprot:1164530-Amphidinium_carterae.1